MTIPRGIPALVILAIGCLIGVSAGALAQAPPVAPFCNNLPCATVYARVDATPSVQNAAYASGNDIGGLVSFTLPRTASGLLQSISIQFIGGATTTTTAYCFDSNPTASTFTDKGSFSIAAADEAKRINKVGVSLTPAATTGDTVTAAALDNYAQPFNSTGTIWCAYAAGGIFTPASVTDLRVAIRVAQGAL